MASLPTPIAAAARENCEAAKSSLKDAEQLARATREVRRNSAQRMAAVKPAPPPERDLTGRFAAYTDAVTEAAASIEPIEPVPAKSPR